MGTCCRVTTACTYFLVINQPSHYFSFAASKTRSVRLPLSELCPCPYVWRRMRFPFRESRLNHKTKGRRGRKKLPFQNEILRVKVESLDWKWLSHDSDMRISQTVLGHVRQEEWAFWQNALTPRFRRRVCIRLRGRFFHVSRNLRHIFRVRKVSEIRRILVKHRRGNFTPCNISKAVQPFSPFPFLRFAPFT